MKRLQLANSGEPLSVLALGAHSDDIEIGAGATLLTWMRAGVRLDVTWCVLSATGPRAVEAEASARAFLSGASTRSIEIADFRDSFFPDDRTAIKTWLSALRARSSCFDVILTHRGADAHQDHRVLNELTWNLFRDHTILEYEIPKWDGDIGQPNLYVPVTKDALLRKVDLLMQHFSTQRSKDWFDPEVFMSVARLRGMECRAPERYAEAFIIRKMVI